MTVSGIPASDFNTRKCASSFIKYANDNKLSFDDACLHNLINIPKQNHGCFQNIATVIAVCEKLVNKAGAVFYAKGMLAFATLTKTEQKVWIDYFKQPAVPAAVRLAFATLTRTKQKVWNEYFKQPTVVPAAVINMDAELNKNLIEYMKAIGNKIIPTSRLKNVFNQYPPCIEQYNTEKCASSFIKYANDNKLSFDDACCQNSYLEIPKQKHGDFQNAASVISLCEKLVEKAGAVFYARGKRGFSTLTITEQKVWNEFFKRTATIPSAVIIGEAKINRRRLVRAPLTMHLKINEDLIEYMKSIDNKIIRTSKMEKVVNPYPPCIEHHCAWPYFGTFVDYMIRRMIRVRYSLPKSDLIAEHGLRDLRQDYQYKIFTKDDVLCFDTVEAFKETKEKLAQKGGFTSMLPRKGAPPYTPAERDALKVCIDRYNNLDIHWKDTIEACLEMARFDALYRAGMVGKKIPFSLADLEAIRSFLEKTERFLSGIEFRSPIMLNPALGIPGVPADADIIDDQAIYDIKNSKYPPSSRDLYQLLGYAALYHHESGKKIETLAILNPIYCMMQIFDASSITASELAMVIKKLLCE